MARAIAACPVCSGSLNVSEYRCERCNVTVGGSFDSCRFCRLSSEHLSFIETYLRCEGNLSRVEKELGLSYPTVRNRLSSAVAALGFGQETAGVPEPEDSAVRRRELLEELARGEISADAAAEMLRRLG